MSGAADRDVRLVREATNLSEGDARVLVGLILAAHKHRSIEAERDAARTRAERLEELLRRWLRSRDQLGDEIRDKDAVNFAVVYAYYDVERDARAFLAESAGTERP